jgi:hypothetical protein
VEKREWQLAAATPAFPQGGADRHIRRGGSGVNVERGRLRRPRPGSVHAFPFQLGRRKRPLPAPPFPRPYGHEGASEGTSQKPTRVKGIVCGSEKTRAHGVMSVMGLVSLRFHAVLPYTMSN